MFDNPMNLQLFAMSEEELQGKTGRAIRGRTTVGTSTRI